MLTVSQAAARLGVTPDRVRKLIVAGGLKAERFGPPPKGRYVISEEDLEAFMVLDRSPGRPRLDLASEQLDDFKE